MSSELKYSQTKPMLISVIMHIIVISFFVFYFANKPVIKKDPEMVMVNLESITIKKPEQVVTRPVVENKVEPVKHEIIEKKIVAIQKPQPNKESFVVKPAEQVEKPQPVKKEKTKQSIEASSPKKTEEPKEENFEKTNYEVIRGKVLANLVHPRMAIRMGWSGVTTVRLTIDSNGRLVDSVMVKSSGRDILDKAAMDAVMALRGQSLPKPQDNTATITIPIKFTIKDEN
jgi:protein TonB